VNSHKINIYSSFQSNRLSYVLDFIFGQFFNARYELVQNHNTDQPIHVLYDEHNNSIQGSIFVKNSGFLHSKSRKLEEKYLQVHGMDFDLFSFVFFMLARVEEYQQVRTDAYDRCSARDSFLYSLNLLEKPILDQLLLKFAEAIKSTFNISLHRKSCFELIHTVDVDQIYAYKAKASRRLWGGFMKDLLALKFKRCRDRWKVSKGAVDPYDTFTEISDQSRGFKSFYFFLMAHDGGPDNALNPNLEIIQNKIRDIDPKTTKGIHPGITSNQSINILEKEIRQLGVILNQKINHSRQHFLKLEIPKTYHNLLSTDISDDHSMGYHDHVGFRAGTTENFYWYDLENEQQTNLLIHPLMAMDVSLKKYMNLSPADAKIKLFELADACREVQGPFCILWHNSSFYEEEGWKGWKHVYEELLNFCR